MRLMYLPFIFLGFSFTAYASYESDGSYDARKPVSKNFGNYPIGYDVKGIIVTKYARPEPKKNHTVPPLQINKFSLGPLTGLDDKEEDRVYSDALVGTIRLVSPTYDEDEK